MSFKINLDENLETQLETINCDTSNIEIIIDELNSFHPLIKLLQNKFKHNTVTVICFPYKNENNLSMSNPHKYCFVLSNGNVDTFVDDIQFDTNNKDIEICNDTLANIDNNFILDLFQIYPNIMTYKWNENCNFHTGTRSSQYGSPEGEYIRHGNIIEVRTFSCCCDYSGGVSYYNIEKQEYEYSSCGCFEDDNYLDNC